MSAVYEKQIPNFSRPYKECVMFLLKLYTCIQWLIMTALMAVSGGSRFLSQGGQGVEGGSKREGHKPYKNIFINDLLLMAVQAAVVVKQTRYV